MTQEEKGPDFKYCTVCGSKINFLRKIIAKKQDKKGTFYLNQRQFCSPRCSKIGIKILSEVSDVRAEERERIASILDHHINSIIMKRQKEIQRYGSMANIPQEIVLTLNPGSLSILRQIRSTLNGPKKKESKLRD